MPSGTAARSEGDATSTPVMVAESARAPTRPGRAARRHAGRPRRSRRRRAARWYRTAAIAIASAHTRRFRNTRPARDVAAPAVVGRERELSDLAHVVDAAAGHGPRAVVIRGDAGVGKTTVLRALLAHAASSGMRVIGCAPTELEMSLSSATERP